MRNVTIVVPERVWHCCETVFGVRLAVESSVARPRCVPNKLNKLEVRKERANKSGRTQRALFDAAEPKVAGPGRIWVPMFTRVPTPRGRDRPHVWAASSPDFVQSLSAPRRRPQDGSSIEAAPTYCVASRALGTARPPMHPTWAGEESGTTPGTASASDGASAEVSW